jgi:hypothetical protein
MLCVPLSVALLIQQVVQRSLSMWLEWWADWMNWKAVLATWLLVNASLSIRVDLFLWAPKWSIGCQHCISPESCPHLLSCNVVRCVFVLEFTGHLINGTPVTFIMRSSRHTDIQYSIVRYVSLCRCDIARSDIDVLSFHPFCSIWVYCVGSWDMVRSYLLDMTGLLELLTQAFPYTRNNKS